VRRYVTGLDGESVKPEGAPGTTIHRFGVSNAAFFVVEEHDHTERTDVAYLRPEQIAAFRTCSQHPLMLARPYPGIHAQYGAKGLHISGHFGSNPGTEGSR
jgi:hypothetical protein